MIMLRRFTTLDIVLMALLAVANGVLSKYLTLLNTMLNTAGGPILTSTIVGLYMIYGVLAMYIIRKPGTAFLTFMLGACVQSLFGIAYSTASAFVAALCYAIAVETVFALYRYRHWGYKSMMFASLCAVPLWFVFASMMYGYYKWDLSILLIALVVRCASGVVLCGIVSKWLGDGLLRAGLLKRFAIGKRIEA